MPSLLIAAEDKGVQRNLKPFMIPDKAFPDLMNAFVYRGRVQRKSGYSLLGRLQRNLEDQALVNTDGGGAFTGNIFSILGILATQPDATVVLGSISIEVGAQTFTEPSPPDGTLSNGSGGTGTINYATGAITIQTSPPLAATPVTISFGYYPGLPVMGIRYYEDPTVVNQEKTIFFDTRYAYNFTNQFQELPSTIPSIWTGADYQQFWTTTYQGTLPGAPLFWATNGVPTNNGFAVITISGSIGTAANITTAGANTFALNDEVVFFQMDGGVANATTATVSATGNPFTAINATNPFTDGSFTGMVYNLTDTDGIRYYDNTTWNFFTPVLSYNTASPPEPTSYLLGCLLIVPYKGRLVVLNTFEGVTGDVVNYRQRARWSQIGDPTDAVQGWRDDIPGRGDFEDAATDESIISCGFVKDELIVYFERSTWKLVYTGNEIGPFIWQRINSELGAESTFSAVQFDAGLIALGNVGIHTCNGSQVQRIDGDIPDTVYDIHNGTDGPLRVSAIRDFYQEIVYFAYPDDLGPRNFMNKISFPDRMIIYNYRNDTFSFTDDAATSFGYFQRPTDVPWSGLTTFTWAGWNIPWDSGVLQSGFPSVAFGNHQGFVEIIYPFQTTNDPSLMITNISGSTVTSPQHNLNANQFVTIQGALGVTGVNGTTFKILSVIDEDNFMIDGTATGIYLGGGTLTVLTNVNILTKQFTPFWENGQNYTLKYIDVLVDRTAEGELQVDVYIDFSNTQSMTDTTSGVVLGRPILSTAPSGSVLPYYRFQNQQEQIWKRFYTIATGETFQVRFSFNDTQMKTPTINQADVVLHAFIFFFEEAGEFY